MAELEQFVAPREYLRRERAAVRKSEYVDGRIYAMTGGSPRHGAIAANLIGILQPQLISRGCSTLTSDVRVMIPGPADASAYFYPDLSVTCDEATDDSPDDVLTRPILVVEVLSPSTEAYDRRTKLPRYQSVASLREILLVAQDEPFLESWLRRADGSWTVTSASGLNASALLASVECTVALADVYARVRFPHGETG